MSSSSKLLFQIEVKRVLEILSNDIYDSPYALLRENIQNAFDAIMIRQFTSRVPFEPKVEVFIGEKEITIKDNGIGMDEYVVSNNFWKAGSSGKNNETARKAGVVGTFGIGAMANFGVCKSLKVTTHFLGGNETIETFAVKENLSVSHECIDLLRITENRNPGTEVVAVLDDDAKINLTTAVDYLRPYVKYVRIPVLINGDNISQNSYAEYHELSESNSQFSKSYNVSSNAFKFNLKILISRQNLVKIYCTNIRRGAELINGDISLSQNVNGIYGLRNYFGLAPVPVSSYFNLGGIVNLSTLHPTAGREALSRESIEMVRQIISICENVIAEKISELEVADLNIGFLNYISAFRNFDLAKKIKIEVKPEDDVRWELGNVVPIINGKKVFYYGGRDSKIINQFGNENTYLLLLSQDNPRRKIQQEFIKRRKIPETPDRTTIGKIYQVNELGLGEIAIIVHITNILNEDYLIANSRIEFAEISHEVPSLVQMENEILVIYLSRDSAAVKQVAQTYKTAYEVFGGFVKDFVRNYLYQKFSSYVPSSTKQGADALHRILLRNKELYKYETGDVGKFENLIAELALGEKNIKEVLAQTTEIYRSHMQTVGKSQVGTVEDQIPSIIETEQVKSDSPDLFEPFPPIFRLQTSTDKKILSADKPYPQLNNFTLFISLSDKVYRAHRDFFLEPHTSKVIWSMHRVVYVFTHASNKLSFYYDIELKERLNNDATGGKQMPTTTVISANHIYIPVPNELIEYFEVKRGTKEFYVRYDVIVDATT